MADQSTYRFRLRWQLEPRRSVQHLDGDVLISLPSIGHCKLNPIADATNYDGQSLALTGPPTQSKEMAMKQGEIALGLLLQATLKSGYAVQIQPLRPGGWITQYGMDFFAQQIGGIDTIYRDSLGITIFEEIGETRFVSTTGGNVSIAMDFGSFVDELALNAPSNISRRNLIAYELYASSRFEVSSRARFLLLVMAIESLAIQAKRAEDEQGLITHLSEIVSASALDEVRRTALMNGLQTFRKVSIGESCRSLISEAVNAGTVEDTDAANHFRNCYRIRGKIVHSGKTPSPSALSDDSNRLEKTVRQLICWALQQASTEPDELWSSEFARVMSPS